MQDNLICDNGQAYWLVRVLRSNHDPSQCSTNPLSPGICPFLPPTIKTLPGIPELDGDKFGGVTKEMLTLSALKSWNNNGKKNGWASTDATTQGGMNDIMDNGINAQGVVNIPVCGFKEAIANGYPDRGGDNWPCN